ncbi:uncharacterized protein ATNIH1004_007153 [Aspergillus tanneri]|uniref:Uncharacterized protein n=1 Tax=Aspergillus tanneri TaxID=1220188 RepID=A0A5M9MK03_9EURO|nr:uncharacterized protein ATNIH1004_007153 [Aspergillus tanneri]KAA8645734.1 hypothetical protein ATNIH1004_007153 [Aspergillus tanneri]
MPEVSMTLIQTLTVNKLFVKIGAGWFALATWFQRGIITAKERGAVIRQFASVQKRAAVMISDAFQPMFTEALNIELYLLPTGLQISYLLRRRRYGSLQDHSVISHSARRYQVVPYRGEGTPGYEGKVGATAVVPDLQRQASDQWPPWSGDHNYCLRCELQGVQMVLEMVKQCYEVQQWSNYTCNGVRTFSDSQAALKELRRPRLVSGQEILRGYLEMPNGARNKTFR